MAFEFSDVISPLKRLFDFGIPVTFIVISPSAGF